MPMYLDELKDRQATIKAQFDELTTQRDNYQNQVNEWNTELVKQQGEYRLITDLIDNYKGSEPDVTEPVEGEVLDGE